MAHMKLLILVFYVFCAVTFAQQQAAADDESKPKPPTTKPPKTTTVAPNTTTVAPNTTTAAPITTTTVAPKPTPVPEPETNEWAANFTGTNDTCLVVRAALQYEMQKPNSNDTIKINVPKNATVVGTCGGSNSTVELLRIDWEGNNSMVVTFLKNNTKFEIANITVTLTVPSNENATVLNIIHEKPEFAVSLKNSYKCAKVQILNFTVPSSSNGTVARLHVSNLQFQAFRNVTNKEFSSAWDCEGVNTPDVVPIVVGCVLAALVVVVLAAYLFGRRRCQARGYLSM